MSFTRKGEYTCKRSGVAPVTFFFSFACFFPVASSGDILLHLLLLVLPFLKLAVYNPSEPAAFVFRNGTLFSIYFHINSQQQLFYFKLIFQNQFTSYVCIFIFLFKNEINTWLRHMYPLCVNRKVHLFPQGLYGDIHVAVQNACMVPCSICAYDLGTHLHNIECLAHWCESSWNPCMPFAQLYLRNR